MRWGAATAIEARWGDRLRQEVPVLSDFNTLLSDVFCDARFERFVDVTPQIKGPSNIVAFMNKGTMPLVNPPSAESTI